MNWKNLIGLTLLGAGLTHAHLVATSLLPKGGETLKVGDNISISWDTQTNHNEGIDIALSKDGGTTWKDLKTGLNDNVKLGNTFKWVVTADAETQNGLFRVCQSGPCTNQKVSRATGNGGPWYLVSGAVTISPTASGILGPQSASGVDMDFNPSTRNVEVSFSLARSEVVLLQAFDAQGRLATTLIDGDYAAGSHALSVFSNGLTANGGSLVFKLKVGDQAKTHTWMSVR
ncbi:MAG: hypothetical protein ABIW76_13425 [Fibrobacteria bacterium]